MARNTDQIAQIQSNIEQSGAKVITVPVDAISPASVKAAFEQVRSQLDSPDVFVYNAGFFKMAGILELTPEQFENAWKVNCLGAFLSVQQVLPATIARNRGTILLTGATAALKGSARFAALAVGKFGLRALAQSLAREFGAQGIHVAHIVVDGMINTQRVRAMVSEREDHTMLNPDAIAEMYWQLHQQDATAWTLELDLRPAVEKF